MHVLLIIITTHLRSLALLAIIHAIIALHQTVNIPVHNVKLASRGL